MTLIGFGQLPGGVQKPELPGYVTTEQCTAQLQTLQRRMRFRSVGALIAASLLTFALLTQTEPGQHFARRVAT